MRPARLLALLSALLPPPAASRAGEEAPALERSVTLEGVRGRIDHLALSPDGRRLAVAALGNDTIEIVDLEKERVVHRIRDVGAPTAGVFTPDGRLAMAAARDGRLHFFDAGSFEKVRSVDVGEDADPVRADGPLLFVGFGEGAIAAVEKDAVRFRIPLDAHPEGFQLESKGPRIFVNVPDAGHVAVLDREKRAVIATWKLDARDNYPMVIDEPGGRLLVGCRAPATLLVLDLADGGAKAKVGLSGDVDDLFLDAEGRRLYASCGEGFLDVLARRDADRYERIAQVPTAKGARTSLLDAAGGRLFVAVPAGGGKPAEIRVYRTGKSPAGK